MAQGHTDSTEHFWFRVNGEGVVSTLTLTLTGGLAENAEKNTDQG